MVLAFLEMMEVMSLPIIRKRLQKAVSFQKTNPKTATAQQFFSRERTGHMPTILISAKEPMKCSHMMGTASPRMILTSTVQFHGKAHAITSLNYIATNVKSLDIFCKNQTTTCAYSSK